MSGRDDEDDIIDPEDRLAVFLYLLARSGMPMGTLEALKTRAIDGPVDLREGPLLDWACKVSLELAPDIEPAPLEPDPNAEWGGFVADPINGAHVKSEGEP